MRTKLKFVIDVVKGMEYLSAVNFVHRVSHYADSARSCLWSDIISSLIRDFPFKTHWYNRILPRATFLWVLSLIARSAISGSLATLPMIRLFSHVFYPIINISFRYYESEGGMVPIRWTPPEVQTISSLDILPNIDLNVRTMTDYCVIGVQVFQVLDCI